MDLIAGDPADYLAEDEIIDFSHPAVRELATDASDTAPIETSPGPPSSTSAITSPTPPTPMTPASR